MNKNLIPTYYAKNIFEVDISFFKEENFKYIFADLDNTLDNYKIKIPSPRVKELVENYKKEGISLIIISNNNQKRVETYSKELNITYLSRSNKPFKRKINKFITNNKIQKNDIIFIGDQLLTDIKCANKIGVKSLLVDELTPSNQFISKFNKIIDSFIRKKLKKKNMLKDWRDVK